MQFLLSNCEVADSLKKEQGWGMSWVSIVLMTQCPSFLLGITLLLSQCTFSQNKTLRRGFKCKLFTWEVQRTPLWVGKGDREELVNEGCVIQDNWLLILLGSYGRQCRSPELFHPKGEAAEVFMDQLPSLIGRGLLPGALIPWPFPAWVEWVLAVEKTISVQAGIWELGSVLASGKC